MSYLDTEREGQMREFDGLEPVFAVPPLEHIFVPRISAHTLSLIVIHPTVWLVTDLGMAQRRTRAILLSAVCRPPGSPITPSITSHLAIGRAHSHIPI